MLIEAGVCSGAMDPILLTWNGLAGDSLQEDWFLTAIDFLAYFYNLHK